MYYFEDYISMRDDLMCPICNHKLEVADIRKDSLVIDYACTKQEDHYYGQRIKEGELTKIKIRLIEDDGSKLYFKVSYDSGKSEFWTKSNDNHRTEIMTTFVPDFSDINKLKQKIKTYMVFS